MGGHAPESGQVSEPAYHVRLRTLSAILIVALIGAVFIIPSPARADTITAGGADFLKGVRSGTQVSSTGELLLAPGPGTWSKHGLVLPAGVSGAPDSVWARDPDVIRDPNGTYEMWYRGYDGSTAHIMHATSSDGIVWTKTGVVFATYDTAGAPFVLVIGSIYHMWFQGGISAGGDIFHVTSPDGLVWSAPEIALTPGSGWDGATVNTPDVVRNATGGLWMYYTGSDGASEHVGVATSSTGVVFTRIQSGAILDPGPLGSWDSSLVRFPSVIPGPIYSMYYGGRDGIFSIGYAYSEDGLAWTKSARNPFLRGDISPGWDSAGAVGGQVLVDPAGLRIYYTGSDGTQAQIGLATKDSLLPTYEPVGSLLSSVMDSTSNATLWERIDWNVAHPSGTGATLSVRVGNTSSPDSSWSGWSSPATNGTSLLPALPHGRYLQYRIGLTTPLDGSTPIVRSVSVLFWPTGRAPVLLPFYLETPFLLAVIIGVLFVPGIALTVFLLRKTRRP